MHDLALVPGVINIVYLVKSSSSLLIVVVSGASSTKGDGHLYTWGRGFGSTSDVHCPRRLPSSLCFIQVALGWNHMLVLTGVY